MPADEKRLEAEFPDFLDLLENVANYVGSLDLAKVSEVPAGALSDLHDGLLRALDLLYELFALRGAAPPSPEPGMAYGTMGPSLKRTLPQRLAASLRVGGLPMRMAFAAPVLAALLALGGVGTTVVSTFNSPETHTSLEDRQIPEARV